MDLEGMGKKVEGRNNVTYWFSWILAVWMVFEVLRSIFEIYEGNRDQFSEGLFAEDPRGKPIDQVPELNPQFHHKAEEKELLISSRQSRDDNGEKVLVVVEKPKDPATPGLPADYDSRPDICTYVQCYIEYWFCY
jgi:hypothetical protein